MSEQSRMQRPLSRRRGKGIEDASRKQKQNKDMVEEKPSTAGSDQDGDLLCMPGMEVGGACGAEDADLLPVFF